MTTTTTTKRDLDNEATRFLAHAAMRAGLLDAVDFDVIDEDPERAEEVTEFMDFVNGAGFVPHELDAEDSASRKSLLHELNRLKVRNAPYPEDGRCPNCHGELQEHGGMVGEMMLCCSTEGCNYAWTDDEGAIAIVF